MISKWPQTLNSQKYPCMPSVLISETHILSVSLYTQPFSRYKVVKNQKNQKCIEWPQNDIKHLPVKSTLCTLSTHPWDPHFCFALWSIVSQIQGCWKSEIFEVDWLISTCHWTLISQKHPVYANFVAPRPKFWSVLPYNQPFSRYKVVENRKNWKCTKRPQNDLEHLMVKGTLHTVMYLTLRPKFGEFHSMTSHYWNTMFNI